MKRHRWVVLLALAAGCGSKTPGSSVLDGQTQFKGDLPALAPVSYTTKAGDSLTTEFAYPGLVTALVKSGASIDAAVTATSGTVLDAIPRAGTFIVKVAPGGEAALIGALVAQDGVIDAFPTSPFTAARMVLLDYLSGTPGACEPHGANVRAVMERGGETATGVDLGLNGLGREIEPIPGIHVVADWAPALTRDVIGQAEAAAASGDRAVINLSLQSIASSAGDHRHTPPNPRIDCNAPSTSASLDCRVIEQEQLHFLEALFQALQDETPAVRANTALVIAAGNAGVPLTEQLAKLKTLYPDAAGSIEIVGATDANGDVVGGWNHADSGMVYARGVNVTGLPGQTCNGTSFAAPEVTRILDELWRANRSLTSAELVRVFESALASCPRIAGPATSVPQVADGSTSPAWMTCALAKARGGTTPGQLTLTVTTAGTGHGTVLTDPFGPSYAAGTVVTLTALPDNGSVFMRWSGACTGTGDCSVTMNADAAVTATFQLVDSFAGTYGGPLGTATANTGCGYAVAVSGQIAFDLLKDPAGNVGGSGSVDTTVTTTVTYTPANTTCTGGEFTTTSTGSVTGTAASLHGRLVDSNTVRPFTFDFTGAWSGNTISGSATASKIMHSTGTAGDQDFPMSATYGSIILNHR